MTENREDSKGKSISFIEIAKLVGKKWQYLTSSEKETFIQRAFAAKEKFMTGVVDFREDLLVISTGFQS
jgi:hypothetical protein